MDLLKSKREGGEREGEEKRRGGVQWYRRCIIAAWETAFTVLRVSIQCPLVLLAKLDWKQGEALGSEKGKVKGSDSSQYGAKGRS